MSASPLFIVRPYAPDDARGWVVCRALASLETQYYDDAEPVRTRLAEPGVALVASTPDDRVIGILDVEIDGDRATIDTVAVHPDHGRNRVVGSLLRTALDELRQRGVVTVDAWTREDVAANGSYLRNGFAVDAERGGSGRGNA